MKQRYVYWQEDGMWLGYWEGFPDYWTQGKTDAELRDNLLDIYEELQGGRIPSVRRLAELDVT